MFKLIRGTIEAEHGTLNQSQVNHLHQLVEQTDFTRLRGDPQVVMRAVTKRYVEQLWPRSGFDVQPDPAAGPAAGPAVSQTMRPARFIVPKKAYICLDSFNRRLDTNDTQVYSWYYTEHRSVAQGFISSTVPLANIQSIKLYQPSVPAFPQINSTNRISIYFREFGVYAYSPSNGMPYHYLLRSSQSILSDRYVDLNLEETNGGVFVFHKPITKLDTLSVSFGNPSDRITFTNDRDTGRVTGYGTQTTITMDNPHNLRLGDMVYISGFTTPSGYDAGINTQLGVPVVITSSTSFYIEVDTSDLTITWTPNQRVTCFYAPFRVIIPMEISMSN